MMKRITLLLVLFYVSCTATHQLHTQHLKFDENATADEKIAMAAHLTPSAEQLRWQELELTAFIHFGINTFTSNEWGDGRDSAELFNPTELDCEQWVRTLKEGGFKMVILTAKHHDGFCLWPTATTEYSVKNSPWREGKGDVVGELRKACSKYGLKFGIYLSPWDRNAECYGDSPAYNKLFIAQLTELLSNYGEVHEVWFDGACAEGANGKRQEYDWKAIIECIRHLQPHAVTAIMGCDVRWVGNEGGLGRETEWSVTPLAPGSYVDKVAENRRLGIEEMSKDLGSRELIARANELYWYPSEVDVSIRPGWFYHKEQDDEVRSLANLVDIYYRSVGCNSVLLLNIPPDRRGLIHEVDAERIKEFGDYITKTFAHNYVVNGNKPWHAEAGEQKELKVKSNKIVNTILLQEDITQGQRVEEFSVELYNNGRWYHVARGTTIGYKRLVRISDYKAERIRVSINKSRGRANIKCIGLYYAESLEEQNRDVILSDIDPTCWSVEIETMRAAIDGNRATTWSSDSLTALIVDMGTTHNITGFTYAPTTEEDLSGTIYRYNFYVSSDGINWLKCDTNGEFSNIMHNPIPYFVHFGKSYTARYFKLEPLEEIDGKTMTSISEIGILTR